MHGGALEIGPPSPPRNRQCRGQGSQTAGPCTVSSTARVAGATQSLTYLMEYDLMSNDQLFGNNLPPPLSGIRS